MSADAGEVEAVGGGTLAVLRPLGRHLYDDLPVVAEVESREMWEEHLRGIVESFAPANAFEMALAARVAQLMWRLRRVALYETTAITASRARWTAETTDPDTPPKRRRRRRNPIWERAVQVGSAASEAGRLLIIDGVQERVARSEAHLSRQLSLTLAYLRDAQSRRFAEGGR